MRRHQFRTYRHGDSPRHRTTHDTARQNTHWIARRKRNCAFGDEAQAQHQRSFTAFLLRFIELTTGNDRRQAKRQRWHHSCRHDRRHRRVGLGTQQANAKRICRFVHRTTHVGTHHTAEDCAQQHRVRRPHGLQPVGQTFQNARDRLTNQVNHRQTDHQAGNQRDDQNRFQRFHTLRQLQLRADQLRHITGEETGNDTADKARTSAHGQHTADKTRRQTRTVSNGEGDKARQHWHHQRKRGAAANLHQRGRQRARLFKRLDTKGEGERNTQAARHHHRQHVGHAGQQVTIRTRRLFFPFSRSFSRTGCLIRFGFCQRLIKLLRGFLQRQAGRGTVHRLAGKLRQIHFDIRRHNHQIGFRHLFRRDGIARANRAAGFNLHPPATFFRFGFNGFSRHKGVRHTCRAGRYRNNAFRPNGGNRRRLNRCAVNRRMTFCFAQKQFRMCHRAINITQPHFFAVQGAVSGDFVAQNNRHFSITRVINDIQVRFLCRRAQQGLRHIGTSLSETGVNDQQRFHYSSPAVS